MYEKIHFGEFQRLLLSASERRFILSDPSYFDTLNKYFSALGIYENSVISFDIFDTILLRDNSSELRRFLEIGSAIPNCRNNGNGSTLEGFLARYLGTIASYRGAERRRNSHEGSIDEIYRTACFTLGLPKDHIEKLIDSELSYEKGRVSLANNLIRIIEILKEQGKAVILLSDMYLRERDIRSLLQSLDIDLELFEEIYSSADSKFTKWSGLAFEMLNELYPACKKIHIGDNFVSDYIQPRRNGWSSIHVPLARFDLEERQACHDATMNLLLHEHGIAVDILRPR